MKRKEKIVDELILDICINCKQKAICFQKKKKKDFADIYLSICFGCPYEMEFKIFSGNDNSELLLTLDNIRTVISKIKSGDVYSIEKTNAKINVFFNTLNKKVDKSKRPELVSDFIKFLTWSDRLKKYQKILEKEFSEQFNQTI